MIGALPLAISAGTAVAGMLNKPKDKLSPYLQAALDEIGKVKVPDVESLKIKLDQYVQQGLMTPEDAQASLVQFNNYDNIGANADARGAQMSALQGLKDQYEAGGLTDTSRSQIQQTLDEVNNNQRGQDQAITQDAHRRGVSGSGLEMAQRMMSQQNSANQAGRQGMDIAAMAEQAKMQALQQAGQLGGQIEDRQYGQDAQKAAAANAISQFNATNQQQVTLQNMAARNAAQSQNLIEKQRVADTNTANENANRERNSGLIQQNYTNNLDKAKATAGALGAVGQSQQNAANVNTKWTGDLISGVNNGLTTFGGAGGFNSSPTANPYASNIGGGNTTLTGAERDKYKPTFLAAKGGTVPGEAPFPGDDPRNDVVDAKLSPGEKVVPRTQTDDYEQFLGSMPRSEGKPSIEAVKTVLQALSEMGC